MYATPKHDFAGNRHQAGNSSRPPDNRQQESVMRIDERGYMKERDRDRQRRAFDGTRWIEVA